MTHFIMINWFNQIGVWIWNWLRVKLNWKIWSVNINITIINGTMIKSPHKRWNWRDGFGWRCSGLKWDYGGWLIHYIGGSFGSSLWRDLKWFIFIRIGGMNFGPRMMQASALCPIIPQHSQLLFYIVQRAAITG